MYQSFSNVCCLFDENVQVKVGVQGAEECADFEEWFNYRLSRAAPETCAEFLGSFIADTTNTQFTKGGKWLVWKFEVSFYPFRNQPSVFDTICKVLNSMLLVNLKFYIYITISA